MAHEAVFQAIADETVRLRAVMVQARDLIDVTRGVLVQARDYAADLKALAAAGACVVQNFPATMPVSGTVSIGNLPNPLPVILPAPAAVTPFLFSGSTSPSTLVAGAVGQVIRLVFGVFGASASAVVSVRSAATDLMPLQLSATSIVLPYREQGYCQTVSGDALRIAFSGAPTVTAFGLWVAA